MSNLEPGTHLDKLVFTSVMGLTMSHVLEIPRYSTDIAAAFEIVNKLFDDDFTVTIECCVKWRCEIMHETWDFDWKIKTVADSAPHAICLAALKAVGKLNE